MMILSNWEKLTGKEEVEEEGLRTV